MKEKKTATQKALTVWGIVLIIWAFYRAKLQLPQWFDEFLAKPVVFVAPIYYYIVKIEHKKFLPTISLRFNKLFHDIGVGLVVGIPIFIAAIYAYFFKNHDFQSLPSAWSTTKITIYFVMALATACSEEILSRGFILKRLYQESKNVYTSSFFASILFFFLHIPILLTSSQITGNTLLLLMLSTVSLSLINSFVFLAEDSLLIPILVHAFYSASIFLFL